MPVAGLRLEALGLGLLAVGLGAGLGGPGLGLAGVRLTLLQARWPVAAACSRSSPAASRPAPAASCVGRDEGGEPAAMTARMMTTMTQLGMRFPLVGGPPASYPPDGQTGPGRRSGGVTATAGPWSAELAAQLDEHPGQDPGHLHLGDADLLGDLRLGLLLEEPEVEDLALALGERPDRRGRA